MSGVIRQTNRDAYEEIVRLGLLTEARFRVYDIIYRFGPINRVEIVNYLRAEGGANHGRHPDIYNRLSELAERGVIELVCSPTGEILTRECGATHMAQQLWQVTRNVPCEVSRSPPPPSREVLLKGVTELYGILHPLSLQGRRFTSELQQTYEWLLQKSRPTHLKE